VIRGDMDFDNDNPELRSAHVVVVGNEKGGAGKSTLSIHIAVALMKTGHKVACIDLDTRQQTMTRFFENRASWSSHASWPIEMPRHCAMGRGESDDVRANEAQEFAAFAQAISDVEHDYEFVVIDTPASDSYLMRLAHSLADTLVSPLNDSYIDIDVFSRVHHDRERRGAVAHYADLVLQARRKRRIVDNGVIDWVMVRNRIASLNTNNAKQIAVSLGRLSRELGFRAADGLHDRVIFRELFPIGLTALDPIEEGAINGSLTTSQLSARREIDDLVKALALPTRLPGVEHMESRRLWRDRVVGYYTELARGPAEATS
jgi:chromosome partitioning protein